MMVNTHEAKTQLSRLIDRAVDGEEVIIGRAGRPLVRLVPYRPERGRRTPGAWRGRVRMSPDFDEADDRLITDFERA